MERFWWTLKHEHVYLHAYDDLRAARKGIGAYLDYSNHERRHSCLEKLTPVQAYEQYLPVAAPSSLVRTGRVAGTPSEAWYHLRTKGNLSKNRIQGSTSKRTTRFMMRGLGMSSAARHHRSRVERAPGGPTCAPLQKVRV